MADKQLFGVFSPVLGLQQNFPVILLSKRQLSENSFVRTYNGEIHRLKSSIVKLKNGATNVQTPDGFPILHYHTFVKRSTGKNYLLVFTKAHIYYWNDATFALDLKFTCASNCTNWETVTYNDEVVATNNVDKVLHSDMSGDFTPLDTASGIEYSTGLYLTKAKYIIVFENFLWLGYTTENGVIKPQRARWSDLGQAGTGNWKTGDAGSTEIGKGDFIKGFGLYKSFLFVFKQKSIHMYWLAASSDIFNGKPLSHKIGLLSSHSIINDKDDDLYFLASDYTIRHITEGEISQAIDPIIKDIKPSLVEGVNSSFIDEYGSIWWAIPYGTSATANNKLISYKEGIWCQSDIVVNAFGKYLEETDVPFLADLGADASGYTNALHNTEVGTTEGYFVISTDLMEKKGLAFYKRILDLDFYFNNGTYLTGSTVDAASAAGQKVLNVTATTAFTAGDKIIINRDGDREEVGDIASIQAGVSVTLVANLTYTHTLAQADVVEIIGKITAYIKRDTEKTWQNMGDVYLYGDGDIIIKHLAVDYRAKTFEIKISATNHFEFLGILFQFLPAGER